MGKEEYDDSAAKKKRKKQKTHGPRRAAPIPMTQEEVDSLISGDAKTQKQIANRLRAAVPSEAPLSAEAQKISDKASPLRITRAEMEEIQRSGKATEKLLERLERRVARSKQIVSELKEERKARPEQVPPDATDAG